MNDIIEIENFLTPKILERTLCNFLTGTDIPWCYFKNISYGNDFNKSLYENQDDMIIDSEGFSYTFYGKGNNLEKRYAQKLMEEIDFIIPFLAKLSDHNFNLLRIRAVYMPSNFQLKGHYHLPHVDLTTPHKTLIYYINDNDGDTLIFNEKYSNNFEYGKKTIKKTIRPKAGKAVLFDGLHYHTGSFSSNNHRILLNCNFT